MGWENCDSIANKRCYFSLGYFDPSAKAGGKAVPFFSTVIDAFENIEIVAHTTMPIDGPVVGLYCRIRNENGDTPAATCAAATAFAKLKMSN